MAMRNRVVQPLRGMQRRMRRPQHTFQIKHKPWQIAPFMIAPVLPGETMKNLLLQARVISDPIKNRLLGWWCEHYFFYVKHRDLNIRESMINMVMDPEFDNSSIDEPGNIIQHYHTGNSAAGAINYVKYCLERVVDEYFRGEGDPDYASGTHFVTNLPLAKVQEPGALDSLTKDDDMTTFDIDVDANADDTITVGEISAAMQQYEFLRQNYAVELSYEDFLKSYGVRTAAVEIHRPELLRFVRSWTYPVSAIDPTDGSAASAVTWNVSERADKDRFFKEPGFILGVTVSRPKVYFSKQWSNMASALNDAFSWMPAVLTNDPRTSFKHFADQSGPLGFDGDNEGYWLDMRDLFLYGDQFINFDLSSTDAGFVALPTASMQKRFVASADIDALFAAVASDAGNKIHQDGIVTLGIATHQMDTSVTTTPG